MHKLSLTLTACLLLSPALPQAQSVPPPVAITMGQSAPVSGLLLPEPTARAWTLWVSERNVSRVRVAVLEAELTAARSAYSTSLATCTVDLTTARQRTWWERNSVWVGFAGGVAISTVTAILLVRATSN